MVLKFFKLIKPYLKLYLNKFKIKIFVFCAMIILLTIPDNVYAYIGPGAGFAFLSSLIALLISFILALFSFLTLPIKILIRIFKRKKYKKKSVIPRIVVVGYDGLDPDLCDKYMSQGKMPNFKKLKEKGCYKRLGTTYPSLSPVAWSSFATGVNPARHKIYDFLMRNPKTYLPELSSSQVHPPSKTIRIGKYHIPLGKPSISFLRKSKSFWKILGDNGVFSHILRVPITFPPEKFYGIMLSAMCTPDLRGTQGTFSFYSTKSKKTKDIYTGGQQFTLHRESKNVYRGYLLGPDNSIKEPHSPITLPFTITVFPESEKAVLKIKKNQYSLKIRTFSPWIKVQFKAGLGIKINGICQFYLTSLKPEIELYISPINIDPEKPALPISHPYYYSVYLAKLFGNYGTLGLLEDTWSLNENILNEDSFIKQAYKFQKERENQFFHALKKTKHGVCACVFDITDRIQHMFFRYLVQDHPANKNKDEKKYAHVIEDLYKYADTMLGSVLEKIDNQTLLFVMSDHGFKPFIRGVNLNSWLYKNGYLVLKNGNFSGEYLQNVDWSKTKAYALGLAGMYLNIKGRERNGIVKPGKEEEHLKNELINKLSGLKDTDNGKTAINTLYNSSNIYNGPYRADAPDMIVGYNEGYRTSWDAAIGKTSDMVFEDNTKNWSGDHGVDPEIVRGILLSNYEIKNNDPNIMDFAPTILSLFGITPPLFIDGKILSIPKLFYKNNGSNKN
ncbi:MAG: alkaline phosphatase family protein [bacterium]